MRNALPPTAVRALTGLSGCSVMRGPGAETPPDDFPAEDPPSKESPIPPEMPVPPLDAR